MHRLVASVEGGLCVTLEHLVVSHFRFILAEINLLFFEINTTDVGYFIAISNRVSKCVISFQVMNELFIYLIFFYRDKAGNLCGVDINYSKVLGEYDFSVVVVFFFLRFIFLFLGAGVFSYIEIE